MSGWRTSLALVGLTRVVWLAVGAAALLLLDGRDPTLQVWRVWDADIYARIAEEGYTGPGRSRTARRSCRCCPC